MDRMDMTPSFSIHAAFASFFFVLPPLSLLVDGNSHALRPMPDIPIVPFL